MLGSWRTSVDETAHISIQTQVGLNSGKSRAHAVKGESKPKPKRKLLPETPRSKRRRKAKPTSVIAQRITAAERRDSRVDALVAKKRAVKRASRHRSRPK